MGTRGQNCKEASIEERLRHFKRDERRVAEMECHVQCLREKLSKLEKMLPLSAIGGVRFTDIADNIINDKRDMNLAFNHTCTIEELVSKEKFLRQQIHDLECTEQIYLHKIRGNKENLPSEEGRKNPRPSCLKNREAKEKLAILETFKQKISTNLKSYTKQNDEVLNNTRRNAHSKLRDNCCHHKSGPPSTYCQPRFSKSSLPCCCDERKQKMCLIESNNSRRRRTYPCEFSSDESEASCECNKKQKRNQCDSDSENESNLSNDDESGSSENSKLTCYCSKAESHEESSSGADSEECNEEECEEAESDKDPEPLQTRTSNSGDLQIKSDENRDYPVVQKTVDQTKLAKVEELCGGLERLKLRNRNLKEFLHSLENPLGLVPKSSESSGTFTLDVAKKTRSGLLDVVKALENKCRNKDAIIVQLTDELKGGSRETLRLKELEPIEQAKFYDDPLDKKAVGFLKKDSTIAFIVLIVIYMAHVTRSEIIFYWNEMNEALERSPVIAQLMSDVNEFSENFLSTFTLENLKLMSKTLVKFTIDQTAQTKAWLYESQELLLQSPSEYFIERQFYIASISGAIVAAIILMKCKEAVKRQVRASNTSERQILLGVYEFTKCTLHKLWTLFYQQLIPSRVLWFVLGVCSHTAWHSMDSDFVKRIDLFNIFCRDNEVTSKPVAEQLVSLETSVHETLCEKFRAFDRTLGEYTQRLVDYFFDA